MHVEELDQVKQLYFQCEYHLLCHHVSVVSSIIGLYCEISVCQVNRFLVDHGTHVVVVDQNACVLCVSVTTFVILLLFFS